MNYKDKFELAYTNEHGETMTLKLDNKNNILIKHDDISATSNFVPLNKEFFKTYGNFNGGEVVALELGMKTLMEFSKSRFKRLANTNNKVMNIENKHKENYQRMFSEDGDLFLALQDGLITHEEYRDRNVINAAIEELFENKYGNEKLRNWRKELDNNGLIFCSRELDYEMQYQSE